MSTKNIPWRKKEIKTGQVTKGKFKVTDGPSKKLVNVNPSIAITNINLLGSDLQIVGNTSNPITYEKLARAMAIAAPNSFIYRSLKC